jgi:hypothetical protein
VFIPIFFFASIYAQVALGDTAQNAGLYLLCFFAGFAPGVQIGGRRLDKYGAKEVVVIGSFLSAVGFFLWASKATDLSLGHQWYYIVIAGAGMGLMLGPANTDALNQVGRLSYGEATGVTQTVRNFGASFGLAALGTLLVTIERNHSVTRLLALGLPSGVAHSVAASLSSNRSSHAPASVPASTAAHIYRVAQLSLADGTQAVFYGMAAIMAVAGLVALIGLRRGIHTAPDAASAAAPPAA